MTDADLILHAYRAWGESCTEHLLGDFSFAIWDAVKQRLFCARDHFGVKLFYYARVGNVLIFSNTLNCLRLHPLVSTSLDDAAIGDFLLFGYNCWPEATTFTDIKRLPAGHTLVCDQHSLQTKCYWMLDPIQELHYKKSQDYVDHFKELLNEAVHDRLRTDRVAVYMSGGLDSSMVAAVARSYLPHPDAVQAHTIVYNHLIPDQERYYSELVAKQLNIPIHFYAGEDYPLFGPTGSFCHPEPLEDPYIAMTLAMQRDIAQHCRVVLTGDEGDAPLTANVRAHGWQLLHQGKWLQFLSEVTWYVFARGRLPVIKMPSLSKAPPQNEDENFPSWLEPSFAESMKLRERWREVYFPPKRKDLIRGDAYKLLSSPVLSYALEGYDASVTQRPLEVRHPLLDLRVIHYLLSLPPVPWCVHKELFRRATAGVLPEAVRHRPKSPLAGDPTQGWLKHSDQTWRTMFKSHPALSNYVDKAVIARLPDPNSPITAREVRLFSLSHWLNLSTLFTGYS